MQVVVGLGNPGGRYRHTRHNAGFLVIDRLASRWGASVEKRQFGALVDSIRVGTANAVLVKPQTFMNLSGQAVVSVKGFYKADNDQLMVIHDDVDLPFGEVRIKRGGGHGGHNGLRDIQQKLGTNKYLRVRFGVSRPPEGWDTADYVLGKWSSDEDASLEQVVDKASDAVELLLQHGAQKAMETVNARRPQRHSANAEQSSPESSPKL